MKIKLTAAQIETLETHPLFDQCVNNGTLELDHDQLTQFITDIDEAATALDAMTYTPTVGRARFATRALAKKLHKLAEPQPEPEPITIGSTVYLARDKTCTYRVIKFNTDGSVQVYGGESPQHQMYRDLPLDALTTQK